MAIFSSLALTAACALMFQTKAEPYTLGKDSQVQTGVPQGTVTRHEHTSQVFAGTKRNWWLYLPASPEQAGPLCVMVFQDGEWYQQRNGDFRVPVVLDNLIHQKKIPPMVTPKGMASRGATAASSTTPYRRNTPSFWKRRCFRPPWKKPGRRRPF